MEQYKSRLKAVLMVRKYALDARQQSFRQLSQQLFNEEKALLHLKNASLHSRNQLAEKQQTGISVNQILLFHHFNKCQQEKVVLQESVIGTLSKQIEKERSDLKKVARELKVIEKIDGKRKNQFEIKTRKKEDDLLDEISSRLKTEEL